MHTSEAPSAALRWLRFTAPRAREGARRIVEGSVWEFWDGDWREMGAVDAPEDAPRMSREIGLFREYAQMQRERVTDFRGVLPDEYAVEVTNARGEARVDYKGVPIKNADGTLNKYGKALIEAHETPNRRESELASEINAVRSDAAREAST